MATITTGMTIAGKHAQDKCYIFAAIVRGCQDIGAPE